MKLIIDIGESYYKEIKENKNTNAYKYAPYKLIANGKLLQAELEEIKAEIGRIKTEEGGDFLERPAIDIIYESQKILDNHIKELKEDNNGNLTKNQMPYTTPDQHGNYYERN